MLGEWRFTRRDPAGTDGWRKVPVRGHGIRTVLEAVDIAASADAVFAFIDDIRNVGWHMIEQSSMAMIGS